METREYPGISLIRVIKELAGRVRLLEEIVRQSPDLRSAYEEQLGYQAAYEEDEYRRLVGVLTDILNHLSELEEEPLAQD